MPARRGFTLIELLVVMAIIGLLLAIALPAIFSVTERARRMQCQSNLHQLALAVTAHHNAYRRLPTGHFEMPGGNRPEAASWSWLANLLPYVEEKNLHRQGGIPRSTLRDSGVAARQIPLFLCPSDPFSSRAPLFESGDMREFAVGQTNYQAVAGSNWGRDKSQNSTNIGSDWKHLGANGSYDGWDEGDGIMQRSDFKRPKSLRHATDGLSRTLLIGEQLPEKNRWCSWPYANGAYGTCAIPPNVVPREGSNYNEYWWPNVAGFRSVHAGGLNFALADGAAQFIADEIDLALYRALATIAGGESAEVPQ